MKPLHHLPPLIALVAITRGEVLYGVSTDTIPDFIRVSTLKVPSLKRDMDYTKFEHINSLGQCNSACGSIKACVGYTFTLPRGCYLRYCRSSLTYGDTIEFGGNDFLRYPFETEPDWAPLLLDEAAMDKFQQKAKDEIPWMCIREAAKNEGLALVNWTTSSGSFSLLTSKEDEPYGAASDKSVILGYLFGKGYSSAKLPYGCDKNTTCLRKLYRKDGDFDLLLTPLSAPEYGSTFYMGIVGANEGCCGAVKNVTANGYELIEVAKGIFNPVRNEEAYHTVKFYLW